MTGVLEVKVLALLLKRKVYMKYKGVLKVDYFKNPELKSIFKTTCRLHEKFKRPRILTKDIWIVLEKRIDDEDQSRYIKLLKSIRKVSNLITKDEEEVLHYSIIKFAQENLLKNTLHSRIQELQSGIEVDLTDLKMQVDHIISLNGNQQIPDYEYLSQHEERIDIGKEPPKLPTGISQELDHHLSGGLAAGELGFFLAPPGRGKTLALVNIGANALKQGRKVLHVTLEIKSRIVGKRYDCCLTESTYDEIREEPTILLKKIKELRANNAELIIKDYSYSHCGVSELSALMEEHHAKGRRKVDLLVVDYADLLIPPQKYKETRFEISRIYEELRIMAGQYDIPIWTASQSNRISLTKKTVSMIDIAEAFSKANTADLILALCQTEEEKLEKEMRIYIAKTRMGETNPTVLLTCDLRRMLLKARNSYDLEATWNKPRLTRIREGMLSATKGHRDRPRTDSNRDSHSKTRKKKSVGV